MKFLKQYGVIVAFFLLFIVSAVMDPGNFLRPENLLLLVRQNVDIGLIAVGMTIVIVAGGIDLSVGALMTLAAAVGLTALNQQGPAGGAAAVAIATVVTVGLGTVLGLINGLLVTMGRLAPFVATLCGLVAFRSLALVIGQAGEIRSMSPDLFPRIANEGINLGGNLKLTWGMMIFIGMAVIAHILLERTALGRGWVAVGSNEKASHYAALPVAKLKTLSYVFLGLCSGLAGLIYASRLNSVSTNNMGTLYELDAIAAVVIGGASLAGGKGKVINTVFGVLILALIGNMLVLQNVDSNWKGFVKGAIILLAVMVQRERKAS